ncbi:MAG: DUF4256 domain-containing protein [Arcanobacterium sp.]|nr:DUF4256 domain-containing protein [Arcanobacterium sp.]
MKTLQDRFDKRKVFLGGKVNWDEVAARLADSPQALEKLAKMEETGGEPELIGTLDGKFFFADCYKKIDDQRKNLCYDEEARLSRKKFPPRSSVLEEITKWDGQLLTEELYFKVQEVRDIDLTVSSWLVTEEAVRAKKGAIFGDRRFGRTFIYHNTADCYFGSRGYRTYILL